MAGDLCPTGKGYTILDGVPGHTVPSPNLYPTEVTPTSHCVCQLFFKKKSLQNTCNNSITKIQTNKLWNGQRTWVDNSPKKIQMTNKHVKMCSMQLINRKMQIKPTMRYHFIPTRMDVIKKMNNNKGWEKCGEIGTFVHCLWECKKVQLLWKTVCSCLKA